MMLGAAGGLRSLREKRRELCPRVPGNLDKSSDGTTMCVETSGGAGTVGEVDLDRAVVTAGPDQGELVGKGAVAECGDERTTAPEDGWDPFSPQRFTCENVPFPDLAFRR